MLPPIISTVSRWSVGAEMVNGGSFSSAAWVAANRAFHVPFYIPEVVTVVKLWWLNGSSVSGNVRIGIYRQSDLSLIVSSGAVAQAGTSAMQEADIADTVLTPGTYYVALALDNNIGHVLRSAPANTFLRAAGVTQESSAYPLPPTMTPVVMSTACLPQCGMALRTLVA